MIIVLWNKDMRRRKRWLSSLALNNWNIVILFLVCRSVDHWKTLEYVKQCCSKLALAVYSTVYFWTSSILISKTCFIWQKNILTEKKTYLCLLSWFSSTWPIIGDFPGGLDCKASVYNVGDRVRSLGRDDLLQKEMAIHSSTIAWKIPRTEEPGRLKSMGSQSVGHDGATSLFIDQNT